MEEIYKNFLLTQLLQQNMFFASKGWMVGFSYRGASTLITRIFLRHLDLERSAIEKQMWISDYRDQVLRPQWAKDLREGQLLPFLKSPEILRIKFVRNPFIRLVSAFVHCFRFEARPDLRRQNPVRADWIGPLSDKMLNISFRQFVFFLAQKGVQPGRCNPHYSHQKLLFEGSIVNYRHVFPVEKLAESFAFLSQIDPDMPTLKEGFDKKEKSYHQTKHDDGRGQCVADLPFTKLVVLREGKEIFPPYRFFYDKQLKEMVANLYHVDFTTYGYSKNKIPLN